MNKVTNNSIIIPESSNLCIGNGRPWQQQYDINIEQSEDITNWVKGPSLPEPISNSSVIVTKNRVYLLGGCNNINDYCYYNYISTVYTASINNNGTLGTWTTGPNLPEPLTETQIIITKNKVHLLGGFNGKKFTSTVYTASISGGLNDYSFYYS